LENELNEKDDSPLDCGGDIKECELLNDLGLNVECQSQITGRKMVDNKCIVKNFILENPRVLNPLNFNNDNDFLDSLWVWYVKTMKKSPETFRKRRNLLVSMSEHPIFPINLRDLNPDQIYYQINYDSQNYSKNTARGGKDAIINKMKALFMVAQACDIDTRNWNIPIPKRAKPKHKIVPLPNVVYNLIHGKYSNDPYENALYCHTALHGFLVGPRITSEFPIMKLDNVHLDEGYIHFYQPKVDEWRMSPLEKEVLTMTTRKSYKNYIDKWRPKVENQFSKDYLYLQPDGKPFNKETFRNKLNKMYKRIYPDFHPYCMRDWCAIARLINTKINDGNFDIYNVCDWFEHSDISVTQSYTKSAKKYYQIAPFNWIKAVLKSDFNLKKLIGEENSLNRNTQKNDRFRLNSLPMSDINPHGSVTFDECKIPK
jgi:site-specific recombinase XerD